MSRVQVQPQPQVQVQVHESRDTDRTDYQHLVAPVPIRVNSLRGALRRRRSSFPPDTSTPTTDPAINPFQPRDLDNFLLDSSSNTAAEAGPSQSPTTLFASLGLPDLGLSGGPEPMWTPSVGWETLLNFDGGNPGGAADLAAATGGPSGSGSGGGVGGAAAAAGNYPGPSGQGGQGMIRGKSEPGADRLPHADVVRVAQFGNDLAWRTILASQVEVEGVGQLTVARVLQEIWKRGGGDQVTNQCLWPTILMALSLPESTSPTPGIIPHHIPQPSPSASLALQNTYNLSLRHWEPSIFSGLLASFGGSGTGFDGGMSLTAMLGAAVMVHNQQQHSPQHQQLGAAAASLLQQDPAALQQSSTSFSSGAFGISTPQKELDLSQWTNNLTPGIDWDFLTAPTSSGQVGADSTETSANANVFAAGPSSIPRSAPGQGPSSLAFELRHARDPSVPLPRMDDEGIRGIDELLAQMEEEGEAHEARLAMATFNESNANSHANAALALSPAGNKSVYQMPTPETDSSDITSLSDLNHARGKSASTAPTPMSDGSGNSSVKAGGGTGFNVVTPPSSNSSPFTAPAVPVATSAKIPPSFAFKDKPKPLGQLPTPASSSTFIPRAVPSTAATTISAAGAGAGAAAVAAAGTGAPRHSLSLTLPAPSFIPPPPMCMFFSPSFHDMENGKVGVWKGDLHVRGKGGGKFSVLIVGEQATGHLWQSHLWPSSIAYPAEPPVNENSSATASMIPVAHLAREGFTPAAMGMVLCNDSNIQQFVHMVQGFHAEGVAFHLSTPDRLPIVFLPAKFTSADPLQRLGVAFMTKPGLPLPSASSNTTTTASQPNSAVAAPASARSGARKSTTASSTPTSESRKLPSVSAQAQDRHLKKKRRQSAPAGSLPPPALSTAVPAAGGVGPMRTTHHKKRESTVGRRIQEEVIDEAA